MLDVVTSHIYSTGGKCVSILQKTPDYVHCLCSESFMKVTICLDRMLMDIPSCPLLPFRVLRKNNGSENMEENTEPKSAGTQ